MSPAIKKSGSTATPIPSKAQSGMIGNLRRERVSIVIAKMREIESSVENRCGVKNLSAGMKNDCLRTQCVAERERFEPGVSSN